jgi:hypothetical protein
MGPDHDRHNGPTTFETRGDANAYLSIMESRIIKGKWNPTQDVVQDQTLAVYANWWLADRDLKPRTRVLYRNLLDRRILPALGGKPLVSLTASQVRAWYGGPRVQSADRQSPRVRLAAQHPW